MEPAKYPFAISRAGVGVNFTPWLRQLVNDINLGYIAGYYRIGDYSAISGSLRYFSLGEVDMGEHSSNEPGMTINPYEMSVDVAYSLMLSEKFSIAAAVRWIYSDLTYDYTSDTSPGSAFAADLALYYQSNPIIAEHECQLGLGMNISNIGSKITFGGSDNSEFIPTNLRLAAYLKYPLDEYNSIGFAVDANKLLSATYPKQNDGESTDDIRSVCRKTITTCRASPASSRASAMRRADSRRSRRRYNGAWERNTPTTTASRFAPAITTRARTRATENISPWERASE